MGHADRVGDLDLAAVGRAGRHDVLGDPAGRVRGRAVDLGRVLARERTAAVATHAAVRVDDDLAAGQAAVAVRAADHEVAGRVDPHVVVVVGELLGDRRPDDLLDQVGADHAVAVDAVLVLGRDQHALERDRLAVLVLVGDLGLAVGAQVREPDPTCGPRPDARPDGAPSRSAAASGRASRCRRSRTSCPGRRRPGALSTSSPALPRAHLFGRVDALGDVGALLVDRHDDAAGVAVEAVQALS